MRYIFRRSIDARLIIKDADLHGTFWKLLPVILYPGFSSVGDEHMAQRIAKTTASMSVILDLDPYLWVSNSILVQVMSQFESRTMTL